MGYPVEYGGRGDLGGYISGFETMGFGDLSLLVKCGVQFGLWGGAVQHLGTERHHEAYLQRHRHDEAAWLLRDDRAGSRLQRAGHTHHRHLRPRRPGVRDPHARTTGRARSGSATRRATGSWPRSSASWWSAARTAACTRWWCPSATRRARRRHGVRIEDIGPKLGLDGVDNGRLWFDQVRVPRENAAGPLRHRVGRGRLHEPDRESRQALLHHAQHPDPGPRERVRRGHQRVQGGADDRGAPRQQPAPVRPARAARRSR